MGGAWAELRRRITAWEGAYPGVSTHSFAWRGKEGVLPRQTASACVKCTAGSGKKKKKEFRAGCSAGWYSCCTALRSTVLNLEFGRSWGSSGMDKRLVGSPHPAQACGT